jgi:hypothetical protein
VPEPTLYRERTALGRQRSALALIVIASLLLTSGTSVAAVGGALLAVVAVVARSPRALSGATALAALLAAVTVL